MMLGGCGGGGGAGVPGGVVSAASHPRSSIAAVTHQSNQERAIAITTVRETRAALQETYYCAFCAHARGGAIDSSGLKLAETLRQCRAAEGEDVGQSPLHGQGMCQPPYRAERQRVVDQVLDLRPAIDGAKMVLMMPKPIRTKTAAHRQSGGGLWHG